MTRNRPSWSESGAPGRRSPRPLGTFSRRPAPISCPPARHRDVCYSSEIPGALGLRLYRFAAWKPRPHSGPIMVAVPCPRLFKASISCPPATRAVTPVTAASVTGVCGRDQGLSPQSEGLPSRFRSRSGLLCDIRGREWGAHGGLPGDLVGPSQALWKWERRRRQSRRGGAAYR